MAANFKLEDVPEIDCLYVKIQNELSNEGLKISRLSKLTNQQCKIKFEKELAILKEARPDFIPNIKILYHGTTTDVNLICEDGLDGRLSKKGRLGRGIYFSDDPTKCVKYADQDGHKAYLLVCKVILGNTKVYPDGQQDRELAKEPKEIINGKVIQYDSVKGKPSDKVEYVVYDNRRVLIEYILYYEKSDQSSVPTTILVKQPSTNSFISSDKEDSEEESEDDDRKTSSDSDNDVQKESFDLSSLKIKKNDREQEAGLREMEKLKGKIKKEDFLELVRLFRKTYGC